MKKIIGIAMLVILAVAAFAAMGLLFGWVVALVIFISSLLVSVYIIVAIGFMVGWEKK